MEGVGGGTKWIEGAIIYSCKSEQQTKLFTTLLGIGRERERERMREMREKEKKRIFAQCRLKRNSARYLR